MLCLVVIKLHFAIKRWNHCLHFLSACDMSVPCGVLLLTGKFPGYLTKDHWQVPWLPQSIRRIEVRGRPQRTCRNFQSACRRLGAKSWPTWLVLVFVFCEVSQDQSAGTPAAAGDFGFKVLTSSDPAEKTKKLNAELANGRLAMMAIICEVSQDQSAGTPAAAGDFGFKVLTSSDPAEKTKKLNAELANGRLAMMAIIGMFFQDSKLFCLTLMTLTICFMLISKQDADMTYVSPADMLFRRSLFASLSCYVSV